MYINVADLDECNTNTHNCDVKANCANTVGSHSCTCKAGYTGDGQTCSGKKQINQLTNQATNKQTRLEISVKKKQVALSKALQCVWPVIDNKFLHYIVKAVGGSSNFDSLMTNFILNARKDARKTDVKLVLYHHLIKIGRIDPSKSVAASHGNCFQ